MASFTSQTKIKTVHIDGLAVLKIIKHCADTLPTQVTGSLLGLNTNGILDITHSFPFPIDSSHASANGSRDKKNDDFNTDADGNPVQNSILDEDGNVIDSATLEDAEGNPIDPTSLEGLAILQAQAANNSSSLAANMTADQYQIEMMRMLREINVDNNCVGWYQSNLFGSEVSQTLIETQIAYQQDLGENAVVIVYDPVRTGRGDLSVRAYRLGDEFVKIRSNSKNEFIKVSEIFTEIPVVIQNSGLIKGLLYDMGDSIDTAQVSHSRLTLEPNAFLEKTLDQMCNYVDDLLQDQSNLQKYSRNLMREEGGTRWDARTNKKEESKEKKQRVDKYEKWVTSTEAPDRLGSLVLNKQLGNFCDSVEDFAGNQIAKLFVAGSLQKQTGE